MILRIILGILAGLLILPGVLVVGLLFADAIDEAKRLPTIKEWEWLIDNCEWKWDKEREGQVVTSRNGNSIFLPAAGIRYGRCISAAGLLGCYWSSSLNSDYQGGAYYVYFYSGGVNWDGEGSRFNGQSVRPVSDTPMEGFVDMGNGLFWAEKNEEGYFTYDEAMKLFEK